MSLNPEDFTNGPKQDHPEVINNLEAMQPAEQVTLRHLLGAMNERVSHQPSKYDGKRGADLHRGDSGYAAASVWLMDKGTSEDYPDAVGQIHRSERVGKNGDRAITNYFILDAPDGLQIEKHAQTASFSREKMMMPGDSPEKGLQLALEGLARIAELRKSQEMENELGLSFVSEQEARELLSLIDSTKPYRSPTEHRA